MTTSIRVHTTELKYDKTNDRYVIRIHFIDNESKEDVPDTNILLVEVEDDQIFGLHMYPDFALDGLTKLETMQCHLEEFEDDYQEDIIDAIRLSKRIKKKSLSVETCILKKHKHFFIGMFKFEDIEEVIEGIFDPTDETIAFRYNEIQLGKDTFNHLKNTIFSEKELRLRFLPYKQYGFYETF